MNSTATTVTASAGAAAPTARQRLLRALRGEPADRVPVWLMRQAGRYLPEYHDVRSRHDFLTLCKTPEAAAEVSIQPLGAIGSDAVIIFNDIMLPLEHAGALVEFDERGPRVDNPVRTTAGLNRLESRDVEPDEPVARTIREVRRRVGEETPILGFIGAPWTLATYWVEGRVGKHFQAIGALRFDDPGLLHALLERITPAVSEYLRIQILAGADAVQIFDTWGSILGQSEYAEFSARYIRRIIDDLRADARTAATPVIVYVNGCAPYLDHLAETGADCLSIDWRLDLATAERRLDEIQASAGVGRQNANSEVRTPSQDRNSDDTHRAHATRRISLQGNLDPLTLLAGPEATERAVRRLFEQYPARPGHVFNLGHGILPNTPVASVQRLIEAVKQHGAY